MDWRDLHASATNCNQKRSAQLVDSSIVPAMATEPTSPASLHDCQLVSSRACQPSASAETGQFENCVHRLGAYVRRLALATGVVCVVGLAIPVGLTAHGTEARYVQRLPMRIPHVANIYGLSYTELGLQANRVPAALETIAGRQCLTGTTFGIDVDDKY